MLLLQQMAQPAYGRRTHAGSSIAVFAGSGPDRNEIGAAGYQPLQVIFSQSTGQREEAARLMNAFGQLTELRGIKHFKQ